MIYKLGFLIAMEKRRIFGIDFNACDVIPHIHKGSDTLIITTNERAHASRMQ